jgi:hypothetical protein
LILKTKGDVGEEIKGIQGEDIERKECKEEERRTDGRYRE